MTVVLLTLALTAFCAHQCSAQNDGLALFASDAGVAVADMPNKHASVLPGVPRADALACDASSAHCAALALDGRVHLLSLAARTNESVSVATHHSHSVPTAPNGYVWRAGHSFIVGLANAT